MSATYYKPTKSQVQSSPLSFHIKTLASKYIQLIHDEIFKSEAPNKDLVLLQSFMRHTSLSVYNLHKKDIVNKTPGSKLDPGTTELLILKRKFKKSKFCKSERLAPT